MTTATRKTRKGAIEADSDSPKSIIVVGAAEHNLKHIDVTIPKNTLTVVTGLSGSGKSSLVFDTIYSEGQRRFIESLSPYARQFLGMLEKPKVDFMAGLSPSISIDQKSVSRNPRSTVGTITEIYDYLRLLFSRVGDPHCPQCKKKIEPQTSQQIVDRVLRLKEGTRIMILAPIVRGRKGEYRKEFKDLMKKGFIRARVDGELIEIEEGLSLDRYFEHTIEVVIDRLTVKKKERGRISEAVDTALNMAEGVVTISKTSGDLTLSEQFACVDCGISLPEMEPRIFSWNTPQGACPNCTGIGYIREFDPDLFITDPNRSLNTGLFETDKWKVRRNFTKKVVEAYGFTMDTPWKDMTKKQQHLLLWGSGDKKFEATWQSDNEEYEVQWKGTFQRKFEGWVERAIRTYKKTKSEYIRKRSEKLMSSQVCPVCNGHRLRPESQAITFNKKSVTELNHMSIKALREFFENAKIKARIRPVSDPILREIMGRIGFLEDVGLEYLTLDRPAPSLAGGEAQRIRLASQIGSNLVGVTYVCDEPSIGLHSRDNERLLKSLMRLRDLGNNVLVVEHDEETIRQADYIVDLGPGAGAEGGEVVVAGTIDDILKSKKSITGKFLRGEDEIAVPTERRQPNGRYLELKGCKHNNLKNIDVKIPLGMFVSVTGVSGSGKSSLVVETLQRALARRFHKAEAKPGTHDEIQGVDQLDKVIVIDQSPIGRTPRSNPATYVGLWSPLRELFAGLPESKIRGYKPGRSVSYTHLTLPTN